MKTDFEISQPEPGQVKIVQTVTMTAREFLDLARQVYDAETGGPFGKPLPKLESVDDLPPGN